MKTTTRKEPEAYYAQLNCRFNGRLECFKHELAAFAWIWAQTTPGVCGIERDAEAFIDSSGELPKERTFTLKLMRNAGEPELWHALRPGHQAKLPLYAAAAKARGLRLTTFDYDRAYAVPGELVNRTLAQHFLSESAGALPSSKVLANVHGALDSGFLTVCEVAERVGLNASTALLSCVLLWVDGRLKGDVTSCVGPKWRVRRS